MEDFDLTVCTEKASLLNHLFLSKEADVRKAKLGLVKTIISAVSLVLASQLQNWPNFFCTF